jgi:hypothetical protein
MKTGRTEAVSQFSSKSAAPNVFWHYGRNLGDHVVQTRHTDAIEAGGDRRMCNRFLPQIRHKPSVGIDLYSS